MIVIEDIPNAQMISTEESLNPQAIGTEGSLYPQEIGTEESFNPQAINTEESLNPLAIGTKETFNPQMISTEGCLNPQAIGTEESLLAIVADCVKKRLLVYLVGLPTTEPKNMKIKDKVEYKKLAKELTHKMREQIDETYLQYERTSEGITVTLTPDTNEQFKMQIDIFMERLVGIKFD